MYQFVKMPSGKINEDVIKRLTDNAFIPFDTANVDYAEYLRWLEEGNTPLPADEPAPPTD